MKIICPKSELLKSINIVQKAVPTRTTMTILECILIDARSMQIYLTANDMELGIETIVQGRIEEKGMIALDAKIFSEIIRKLPDYDITIETDEMMTATISCLKAKFRIPGKDGEEFVRLPVIEKNRPLEISQFTLREMIRQTIFSISLNDTNRVMTGEYFEIRGNQLRVVSLDGHRISIRKPELKDQYDDHSLIIPGKTLLEISRIMQGEADDMVSIFYTDNHVLFEYDDTVVVSRLIEGEYFRIDTMIPNDYQTKVTINRKELSECLERSVLLVKEEDKKPIVMSVADQSMGLTIQTPRGSLDETIAIETEGKDIKIGFNPRYLLESLRAMDDEMIDLYLVNSKTPCIIKNEAVTYLYMILPVNFVA